jgi:hypothetical protein
MAKYINNHTILTDLINNNTVDVDWVSSPNTKPLPASCEARHHGDFDNDISCFKSTVQRILLADPNAITTTAAIEQTSQMGPVQEGDLAADSKTKTEDRAQAGTQGGTAPRGGETARDAKIVVSKSQPQINMRPSQSDMKNRRDEINRRFSEE